MSKRNRLSLKVSNEKPKSSILSYLKKGNDFPVETVIASQCEQDSNEDLNPVFDDKDDIKRQKMCSTEPLYDATQRDILKSNDNEIKSSSELSDLSNENTKNTNEEDFEKLAPYYLENFITILNDVMCDDFYKYLFDETDYEIYENFTKSSIQAQKLYVRLFQRKYRWILKSQIAYPEIDDILDKYFEELTTCGFLKDKNDLKDLEECLHVLTAAQLREIGKLQRILKAKTLPRKELIGDVLKHSKNNKISTFFNNTSSQCSASAGLVKRCKNMISHCYKLVLKPRQFFTRVVMLFSIYDVTGDENTTGGGGSLIYQMLASNVGLLKYPSYEIQKKTKVFLSRDEFLKFDSTMNTYADILNLMEHHDYEKACTLYKFSKTQDSDLWHCPIVKSHVETLPDFLQSFTAGAIYTKILSIGVEVLQRLKKFDEAVAQLRELITQNVYKNDYRGRWYDRLALNLEQHLKKPNDALDVLYDALQDKFVRAGHRLALFQRANKIINSRNFKSSSNRNFNILTDPMNFLEEYPKVTIQARRMPSVEVGKPIYLLQNTDESADSSSKYLTRVEDVVLAYMRRNGFAEGIHGEGGTISFYFTLLMWEVIFTDGIADVFLNKYQSYPLDWRSDNFYKNRENLFEDRLLKIKEFRSDDLLKELTDRWEQFSGMCNVNWKRFDSLDQCLRLLSCIGGDKLSIIFRRIAESPRFHSSGFPDLIVWNESSSNFKIIEVKGPGDKLSTKQILWLDYLIKNGIDAEVYHVEAISIKKLLS